MLILHDAVSIFISPTPNFFARFCFRAVLTKLQISPLLPGLRMSTLAKNVSEVVLYENQVSDFVALLWMQTPIGHWITPPLRCAHWPQAGHPRGGTGGDVPHLCSC